EVPSGLSPFGASDPGTGLLAASEQPGELSGVVAGDGRTDLRVASLPTYGQSLSIVADDGPVIQAAGYADLALDGGVPAGATAARTMPATIGDSGQWTTTVCVVG